MARAVGHTDLIWIYPRFPYNAQATGGLSMAFVDKSCLSTSFVPKGEELSRSKSNHTSTYNLTEANGKEEDRNQICTEEGCWKVRAKKASNLCRRPSKLSATQHY